VRDKNPFFLESIILTTYLLLDNEKTNQSRFGKFLFHLIEVTVSIDFARKKKFVFNRFCTS